MDPLVLTFDLGTQSLRAALVDEQGSILSIAQKRYERPYFSKQPGWAEQEASFYWDAICEQSQALKAQSGELWDRIGAVTLTTIRDSIVCVDENGKPLRPVILWLDKRESDTTEPLPFINRTAFAAAGMTEAVRISRRISVCNWVRQNEPTLWDKTHRCLMLSGYLNYLFCGRMADSDASIIGHIPFDCKNRRWMTPKDLTYCVFPIEKEKQCELCAPGEIIGRLTAAAAEKTGIKVGTPFVATGSDKGCESIGLSCLTPEKAAISFGTTATVQYTIDRYVEPQNFMPAYPAAVKDRWNPEIQIYRGYWLISWFKQEFADAEIAEAQTLGVNAEDILNRRLREIPAGCEGLMLQPYFTPGITMPDARGSLIGFSEVHTRMHIYRAIIEGVNYALMEGMESLQSRMKVQTTSVFLAGGGSKSDEICRITANMFGLPCFRTQTNEAAVIGAAMLGFTALGVYADIDAAAKGMVHIRDSFLPDMELHNVYEQLYSEVFKKVFNRLSPLYARYSDIIK